MITASRHVLRCVYVIATAAMPVLEVARPIELLKNRGWTVGVILSPTAAEWLDDKRLAEFTGCIVRSAPRMPTEDDPLPDADAVLAAPLTFNSLNKWAAGLADTAAVGNLCESLGAGVPIVAAPCVNDELRRHPAYSDSIERLSAAGVHFIDPDTVSRQDDKAFDWDAVLREFERHVGR